MGRKEKRAGIGLTNLKKRVYYDTCDVSGIKGGIDISGLGESLGEKGGEETVKHPLNIECVEVLGLIGKSQGKLEKIEIYSGLKLIRHMEKCEKCADKWRKVRIKLTGK